MNLVDPGTLVLVWASVSAAGLAARAWRVVSVLRPPAAASPLP